MSIKLMSAAIDTSLNIEKKFVLMLLADSADFEDRGCVDLEKIAIKCSLSFDKVADITKSFIIDGVLALYDFSVELPDLADGLFCFQIDQSHSVFDQDRRLV